ncbi:hypothetical protein GBA52_000503 [Prunus armeniaca]|nr:hypothetical protein GBA52_000503 [Prunus armeniaca]
MAEIIGPVVQLGQWLWSPAKRGLGYMVHYKRNIESLNLQIEKLQVIKNGNQNLVDAFQLNGEEVKPEIQMWLQDANKAIADAAQLTGEVAASKNCISGMCPDLRWRYNLGKKAMEEKEAVNKLLEKRDFQTISVQVPHPIEIESTMSTDGFQAFGSTSRAMDQVMTALKDNKVTVIGVYGMGGVGKTTMVKQVGAQARKDKLFDHVIMAVFSQNPDLMKIQGQLSDMLGLKFQVETELGRAGSLKQRILSGKKTLIILDDIWNASQTTLTSIGIPSPIELQGHKSKVLITTRRLNVCHGMECNVKVHLNVLSEEESWNLFAKKARKSFESVIFYNVARKVARECAGLPIALIAVAGSLGDKDFDEWKEAARRLEMSQPANLEDDGDVFKCIKLSYDYLKSEDAKSCFLLCSLFAEDSNIAIQDLFSYGFGLGLFRDGKTLEGARAKARSVTKYLKASSLLLDGISEKFVRMHDVIRDMAILIASSSEHGHRFLVKAGWELNVWPNDTDESCSAISLKDNCIRKLPDELVCPKLQILLLNHNPTVEEIPEAFFQSLNALRVLDLTETSISILPSSFNFLINLQTLHLDHYCPRQLVLETTIDTLPSWFNSVVIERTEKIFYSLCRGLNNFLVEYATERLHGLISLSVEECNHMPSLMNTTTTLVPNRPVLEKLEELYVNRMNDLKELCVGDLPHGSLGNLKSLMVKDCKALEGTLLQYAIFHNLKVLTVYRCMKLKTIFTTDASHCLMQLELVRVDNCSSLETIIGASEGTLEDKIIFPQLRCISLCRLPELKSFYSGGSGGVECPSLEYLHVHGCHSQFSTSASDFYSQKQVQVDTGHFPIERSQTMSTAVSHRHLTSPCSAALHHHRASTPTPTQS